MPIRHAIWKVGATPQQLIESTMSSEQMLEEMICAAPQILSEEWMLISQQENTGTGGRIDLLAIAPDGSLVLIELKRNRTPREVIAQALDYAAWVENLQSDDIARMYTKFSNGRELKQDFYSRFGTELDEDTLNEYHEIVVVASALDDSTERIIGYLSSRGIAINVLFFQVFSHGEDQLLSRAWLIDPATTQSNTAMTKASDDRASEPWNGEFYCSFGIGSSRSWEDGVEFGFISAGHGAWYSRTLHLLNPGDRVWVNIPKHGYVGVGCVTEKAQMARDFHVTTSTGEWVPILEAKTRGHYNREVADDPELSEYFVAVKWLHTVPIDQAVTELGFFGNQNSVCKPTSPKWRYTIERLKKHFPEIGGCSP